jgi:hypothetical protein
MSLKTHHILILNILENLKLKEDCMSEKNYKYYTLIKSGSNLTEFELLSNKNIFVLHSCLNYVDITLLMKIFQAIIDRNFCNFVKEDSLLFCNDENQMNDLFGTDNLFNSKNADKFIQNHYIIFNEKLITKNVVIDDISIYNERPEINQEFNTKNWKSQRIHTISTLYQLLRNMT